MPITGSDREFAVVGRGTVFDGIAYWVTLAGIYPMVGGLMFYSGKGKLFDNNGDAPQGIKDQFEGTFLDTFPGVDTAWFILGIFEFGVFVLLLASLIRLEFLPHRDKSILQVGLALALLTGIAAVLVCAAPGPRALLVVTDLSSILLLGALFVTAACSLDDPELPLGLEISVDKVVLTLNDSIRIALTATNYGDTPIALSGPSDCLLFFDVRNTTGASVFGSHQNCVGATVTETIPAGRNREAVFTWHGRNSAGVRLPPGFYGISALALVAGGTRRGASAAIQIE